MLTRFFSGAIVSFIFLWLFVTARRSTNTSEYASESGINYFLEAPVRAKGAPPQVEPKGNLPTDSTAGVHEVTLPAQALCEVLGDEDNVHHSFFQSWVAWERVRRLSTADAFAFIELTLMDGGKRLDRTALQLALLCGGKDVGAFIVASLEDPTLESSVRSEMVDIISGNRDGLFPSLERVAFDGKAHALARDLVASPNELNRIAGCAILGRTSEGSEEAVLMHSAANDEDVRVRAAALRALGQLGQPTSIPILKGLKSVIAQHRNSSEQKTLMGAIDEALWRLSNPTDK